MNIFKVRLDSSLTGCLRVSLKTDHTTAQQTAQLEGDDNVHAQLLDRIDDRTDQRTAMLQKSFRIFCLRTSADHEFRGSSRTAVSFGNRPSSVDGFLNNRTQSKNSQHVRITAIFH